MSTEILTIGKNDYTVELKDLNQADLKFYPDNPRVYSVLNSDLVEPSQEEIEEYMTRQDHVKQLKESIKSNGGLIDPLIVRDGDFTVLEGNSRLAAYRILCEKDPLTWGKVKCKILPSDIPESAVFALLGQYHIIGRKDWDPFEQANYLYRRHKQTKIPIDAMAVELGITKQKANSMIKVITFMEEHGDLNKRHWSYYEEYLKNAGIKKYRETNPDIDDTIAQQIKEDSIEAAADMRKLGDIAKIGDKQSKKVMQHISCGEMDLYEGYSIVEESGKLDDVVKKLSKFRKAIADDSFEKQVLQEESWGTVNFEITKIIQRLSSIQKKKEKNEH